MLKEIPISAEKSSQLPPSAAERGFALLGGFQQSPQPQLGKGGAPRGNNEREGS